MTSTKVLLRDDNKNPVIGDTLPITFSVSGVPEGVTLVKAWLTFKVKLADTDVQAVVQKTITTGFIGTTTVTFTIVMSKEDTALFAARDYIWDLQVKDNSGGIFTPIPDGKVTWQKGVTDASS